MRFYFKSRYTPDSPKARVRNVAVRTRPHVEKPTDSRKHRNTRELRKRRTLSEYLCEVVSDQEENDEKPKDLDVSKYDISVRYEPLDCTFYFSLV